ncbi:MAG TPA: glycine cleavage system aminomethyltransferase GcvT [Nitrososphaerales archaeon]|nr:glycine cleavage system aminomethyltransferase GcvT [Nitrososphaerales archaeon]
MKTTPLYSYHQSHAKLTEFAGYEMPLWYTTTTEEHMAVRNRCGIFDVSHMGRFSVKGPAAGSFLEGLVPTQVQSQPAGKAFYTLLLNEKGGIIDDLIITKLAEADFLVVVNAANAEGDMAHMRRHAPPSGVQIDDVTATSAMMAVQGPQAAAVLQPLTALDLGQLKRFRSGVTQVLRQPSIISRTGYTGEDGFEVIMFGPTTDAPQGALAVWERLVESSAACGLSARDSLRLEAGFPLHGSDIDQETNPFQADLAWVISADKKGYIGSDAISGFRQTPPEVVKKGAVLDRGIPRHGFEVLDSRSDRIGVVTSGSFSPVLKKGIALCRVGLGSSGSGNSVKVRVRASLEDGRLVKPPFYDEASYGWRRAAT